MQRAMPKQVDHDDMRARLLDAAGALFAARGYAASGMRELAAAAGVSTGSLYHYFPDKRALFEQLVERTVDGDLADLEAALAAVPDSTPRRLDVFLDLVRRSEEELQLQSAVLVEYARLARAEEGISLAASRKAHVRYVAALARLLDVSRARAELILHAISGLLLQRFTDGGATPFAPVERQLRALCALPEAP
jgi:AcrR family transcriptional regulator